MRICLILLLTLLGNIGFTQTLYYPASGSWEERPDQGFQSALLDDVVQYALENEYEGSKDLRIAILEGFASEPFHEIKGPVRDRGGASGLIIKDGYIVSSWGTPERVDMTFSVTKSYLSTVAGIAWQKHLISDINAPVSKWVWDGTFDGEHNSQVTWDHLLTQSSDWSGQLFGMYDWADRPPSEGGIDEWKLRKLNTPGSVFEYNDVRVNLLAYSLLQVIRKPLPQVLKEEIMDPIGASTTWRWFGYDHAWVPIDGVKVQSVTGGGHSGGGVFINSYDHARFGLLFARDGRWGATQLVQPEWIDMATSPSAARANYGYMWWLFPDDTQGIPSHVFYAAGFGGNFIVVDQENDMVIVTRWLSPSKLREFVAKVYAAMD